MGFTPDLRNRVSVALGSETAAAELEGLIGGHIGRTWYVNADAGAGTPGLISAGSNQADGLTPQTPFLTMAKALSVAGTLDTICFWGDVREELTGSNLVFDLTIIGLGRLHHPDSPASGYKTAGAMWRPPASPTTATPLLKVRGRGWRFINIAFDCPVDAAAIYLERNALATTAEFDPSHASFIGCRFMDGKYAIEDAGGCYNVVIERCEFKGMSTCAIANTSTAVAAPLNWKIRDCHFHAATNGFGSAAHIDCPFDNSIIQRNTFGTVTSTGKYIDLSGGNGGNIVNRNVLGGLYDTTDYVPGTGDIWYNNDTVVKATYSPDGQSIQVPGA